MLLPRTVFALVVGCGLASGVLAAPPTNEQIDAAVDSFRTKQREAVAAGKRSPAEHAAIVREVLGDIRIEELSIDQLEALEAGGLLRTASADEGLREAFASRLSALAKDTGATGARATVVSIGLLPPPAGSDRARNLESLASALTSAMKHPGLPAALTEGKASNVFRYAQSVPAGLLPGDFWSAAERVLGADLPPMVAAATPSLFDAAMDEEAKIDAKGRERLRLAILGMLDSAIGKEPQETMRQRLERSKAYLNGVYARTGLVGQPAPELEFTWTNFGADTRVTKLSDLKGKVVVIDFWATWCGPCVASFPQVRDLTAHYKGYPVVVLGVTSLQGAVTQWKDGRPAGRVDTKDNPQKEYELLAEFVKALDMTWPVAVSKQDVFNPDYGVRGIPHVVIIDPKGIVRHRGLHPASDPPGKIEKINAILREFNLPAPAKPE